MSVQSKQKKNYSKILFVSLDHPVCWVIWQQTKYIRIYPIGLSMPMQTIEYQFSMTHQLQPTILALCVITEH